MPDIKIDDNCLFDVERRLNVHLNSNKLEQLENQHDEKLEEQSNPAGAVDQGSIGFELLMRKSIPGGSIKDDHALPRVPITNICHYVHEGIELQLQLNSDLPSLQAPEGWYQGQSCVEGFTNVVFMRGDQLFGSRSNYTIDRRHTCLINFQVIHHERIHALAKPISRQTQDNSYSKFAFAKPSALSHTPNDVVAIIFRLVAATPFVAVNRSLSLLQTVKVPRTGQCRHLNSGVSQALTLLWSNRQSYQANLRLQSPFSRDDKGPMA
ncbi:hypothetical protein TNCV_2320451 [Trichonephila clavipes]|nr:hypothetical protein TNCV_2320451 [Trichonephila clavipes]